MVQHLTLIATACSAGVSLGSVAWAAERVSNVKADPAASQPVPQVVSLTISEELVVEMVLVPDLGPVELELEPGQTPVRIAPPGPFYISRYEVSRYLWEDIMGKPRSRLRSSEAPVDGVSWYDCRSFCERLSLITGETVQLPLRQEWLYACALAKPDRQLPIGEADRIAHHSALRVGTVGPDSLGLFDLAAGVSEWCADGPEAADTPAHVSLAPQRYACGASCDSSAVMRPQDPRGRSSNGLRLAMRGDTERRAGVMRIPCVSLGQWSAGTVRRTKVTLAEVGFSSTWRGHRFGLVRVDPAERTAEIDVDAERYPVREGENVGPLRSVRLDGVTCRGVTLEVSWTDYAER